MKRFFIMTRGRTGSSAIVDVLNKSNNICAAQELFLNYKFEKRHYKSYLIPPYELWKKTGGIPSILLKKISREDVNLEKYLNHAERILDKNKVNAFCFKLLSHNFDEIPALKNHLVKRNFKVVYLTRNVPRQVISGMVAKLRGVYNVHERDGYNDDTSYTIDIEEFKSLVMWETQAVANDIAMLESSDFDFIRVHYEDFIKNHDAFFENIFRFLDIPEEKLPESSFSIMIREPKNVIHNYNEVEKCLTELSVTTS